MVGSAALAVGCVVGPSPGPGGGGGGTTPVGVVPVATAPMANSDLAERIRAFPEPTEGAWDDDVTRELLAAFDGNGSNELDTVAEIRAVTCDVWRVLDDACQGARGSSIGVIYGFGVEYGWVGSALGFAESHRPVVADAAMACGVDIDSATGFDRSADYDGGGRPPGAGGGDDDGSVGEAIGYLSSEPESSEWDDEVAALMLAAYDTDSSGEIDRAAEVQAIGCDTLESLDHELEGIVAIYGIAPRYGWVGGALGFDEDMRDELYARFDGCGISE